MYGLSSIWGCIPYSIFHKAPYGVWGMDRKPVVGVADLLVLTTKGEGFDTDIASYWNS
jgi:hypothetical protein